MLNIALSYIARGWNPVPIEYRKKKPSAGNGWQKVRIDASNAAQYFNCSPMNIGVQLGAASNGLVDVDLDCAEGRKLVSAFLPPTASIFGRLSTPQAHWLYVSDLCRTVDKAELQFKDPDPPKDTKAMLVELRIGGGELGAQTVAPGSTHEDTGELIEWHTDGAPAHVVGAYLQRQVARLAAACLIMRHWKEGDRHWTGFCLGGFFARAGWTEADTVHFVDAIAWALNDPGHADRVKAARDQYNHHIKTNQGQGFPELVKHIGEKAAKAVCDWIGYRAPTWGTDILDPWRKFIVPSFPLDTLPPALAQFVYTQSRAIGCEQSGLAMTMLGALSGAIDHRFKLKIMANTDWQAPPNLWVLLIGGVSTKKSPMFRAVMRALREIEAAHRRDWQTKRALAKAANKDAPDPPPPLRFIVQDTTIEAVGEILANQNRGITVLRDEVAGWIGSMDRYQGAGKSGSADRAFWLESYDGGHSTVDRIKRGSLHIENLSASVIGGIQPGRLREIAPLTSDGMLQRFLPVMISEASFPEDISTAAAANDYASLMRVLSSLSPTILNPTPEAFEEAKQIRRRIYELEKITEGLAPGFQGFIGKLPGVLGRLALILHLIADPFFGSGKPVDASTIKKAGRIVEQFIVPHAWEMYSLGEGVTERLQAIASYVLTCRKPRLVPSDFTSNVAALRALSTRDLVERVSPLAAGGWIEPEGSGLFPKAWAVNPAVHEQFDKRRADEEKRKMILAELTGAARRG